MHTLMKAKLQAVLNHRVSPVLFVLTCVLLAGTMIIAIHMANAVSAVADLGLQACAQPIPTHPG